MKRIKLRTKFVLLLSIASLVPLTLVVILMFSRFQTALEQSAIHLGDQIAETAAVEVKLFVVSQAKILDTISTVYDPKSIGNLQEAVKIIERLLYQSENFNRISIISKDGEEVIKLDRIQVFDPDNFINIKDSPEFKIVRDGGIYVGPLYIDSGKPFFNLGRWILDSQGNFSGAVFAQVDAKIMPIVMKKITESTGLGGRVYMVNEKGIVVAHPDLSYILREDDLSSLPVISSIIGNRLPVDVSEIYYNENGEHVLGSIHPIGIELSDFADLGLFEATRFNWFVVAEQRGAVIFAEIYRVGIFSVAVALILFAIAIVSAMFFAQRISTPIEKLYGASLEFGQGNLSYRAGINSDDEIGDLGRSFDIMAESISNSVRRLQDKEKIISAEKNKLAIILSGITNAVVAVDLQKNIILFNKAAETIVGVDGNSAIGKNIQDVVKIFDKEREVLADEYCPVTKNNFDGVVFNKNNLKFINSQGQERYVNLVSGTIREGKSMRLGCILTIQDTTREIVMEKTKSEFVSVAAHQLRTPLTGIKWSLQYLFSGEKGKINPQQREIVDNAFKATTRMIELVNNLLDVSRIEEGRFGFILQKQTISPIFDNLTNVFFNAATNKGLTLKIERTKIPKLFNIDKNKIEIALHNLINNSIKYTLPGGRVELKFELKEKEIIIAVSDTGIGIPRLEFDRIFTKFFRSSQAILFHTDGSGLGLYVAKNIIEQHGGKIWFDSEVNKGTTFYVSLPYAS